MAIICMNFLRPLRTRSARVEKLRRSIMQKKKHRRRLLTRSRKNWTSFIEDSRETISRAEGKLIENAVSCDDGYRVRYADGYVSWSPKETFERAYLPVTSNPNLQTDAPSVSQDMVDRFIHHYRTDTLGDRTTIVHAVLQNGFVIVETSTCVSAENYDKKLGEEICLNKIKDKVWMLLGFLLQTAVNGVR